MSAEEILAAVLMGVWLFIPAMVPNTAAVVFGGGTPVDFGRTWKGRRILGDGKTWRGLALGGLAGAAVGALQIWVSHLCGSTDSWGFGPGWSGLGLLLCLSFGALLGDMGGSFVKRRLGRERGAPVPVLDQLDFAVGALLAAAACRPGWVYASYIEGWHILVLAVLLAAVYVLHRSANRIGYALGLKDEPW